jgi:hypothetical protein
MWRCGVRGIRVLLLVAAIATALTMAFAAPAQAGTCPVDRLITTGSCW